MKPILQPNRDYSSRSANTTFLSRINLISITSKADADQFSSYTSILTLERRINSAIQP